MAIGFINSIGNGLFTAGRITKSNNPVAPVDTIRQSIFRGTKTVITPRTHTASPKIPPIGRPVKRVAL